MEVGEWMAILPWSSRSLAGLLWPNCVGLPESLDKAPMGQPDPSLRKQLGWFGRTAIYNAIK
jgi:hypothetical protein